MFDLMPFGRSNSNVFGYLDDLENNFFGDLSTNASQFRTDIEDKGDHLEMKADLPGFNKDEIKIGIKDDLWTVRSHWAEGMDALPELSEAMKSHQGCAEPRN